MLDDGRMISLKEAAGVLGIAPGTLRQYLKKGKGPAFTRDGNAPQSRIYFARKDLDAFAATFVKWGRRAA